MTSADADMAAPVR